MVKEKTTDKGEPYYPVPTEANRALYQKYKALADKAGHDPKSCFPGGCVEASLFHNSQHIGIVTFFYGSCVWLGLEVVALCFLLL